jgi:murein DD-endopeptidase MepM/ murein hydrolase activator NlpD
MAAALGGCGAHDPAKPVYYIRNAPIPVPYPAEKPPAPSQAAMAAATGASVAAGATVTVAKGDTLYAIARRSGVSVPTLIALNGLQAPYTLYPGDQLRVGGGRTHTVAKGDTLYGISRSYGVDLHSLAGANALAPPYALAVGQVLVVPGGSAATPVRQTVLDVALPAREGAGFAWPLQGAVLSTFGPKPGGLHNDGINIKARSGDPIRAAEAGVVVYAGNGLKSYGNLVLVRHAGGWVTAYAHADRILVGRGDTVKKGDVIAWAGQTGGVPEPQLHFEIRKGTAAVDPLKYLDQG